MSLRDRLTNPKDIERYDRNYNSMEVCITQGELDREYIHIPENATNGDVLMNIFSTTQVRKNGNFVSFTLDGIVGATVEDKWWNAVYKTESER